MRNECFGAAVLGALLAVGAPVQAAPGVTHIPSAEVKAAFTRGKPLLEVAGYKIHASRRESAGQAEIHERDTDILYVLEGTATFVTGGRALDARSVAPGEIRGSSIEGGVERRISPGDVVVVPGGVPHWFREVQGPLLYYVVKVEAEAGGPR